MQKKQKMQLGFEPMPLDPWSGAFLIAPIRTIYISVVINLLIYTRAHILLDAVRNNNSVFLF